MYTNQVAFKSFGNPIAERRPFTLMIPTAQCWWDETGETRTEGWEGRIIETAVSDKTGEYIFPFSLDDSLFGKVFFVKIEGPPTGARLTLTHVQGFAGDTSPATLWGDEFVYSKDKHTIIVSKENALLLG